MSNGASMNYKFGPKNNWRRTIWNRIVDHLDVPVRDAVVLYLAGESDLDRPVALSKGFRPENLIAIERDNGVVKALRDKKVLTVQGDILKVLSSWSNQPVHVVFADFCCGVSLPVLKTLQTLSYGKDFKHCVCAINLMRGRESFSGDMQEIVTGKHRGGISAYLQVLLLLGGIVGADELKSIDGSHIGIDLGTCLLTQKIGFDRARQWFDYFYIRLFQLTGRKAASSKNVLSYKSTSGQVFDSAVWTNVSIWLLDGVDGLLPLPDDLRPLGFDSSVARKITAIRATRTRYLKAA